ncbi:MAG: 5-(carboxyamino)imidazole ribonucleotide mutase [bacterium]
MSPLIGIIMGSQSDWPSMNKAAEILRALKIPFEARVISAHRTPDTAFRYAKSAEKRGLKCIIAGAGGAAHLAGVTAALTPLPVLGVPMNSKALNGLDSLLSIAQMPAGVPVATFSIGETGAANAALFAAQMLAVQDTVLRKRLAALIRRLKKP